MEAWKRAVTGDQRKTFFNRKLGRPYIETARAYGLPRRRIAMRYALRPALTPSLTVMGLDIAAKLGSAFLVETVFGWPGLGRLAFDAILQRDYNLLLGILLFSSMLVVLTNFVIDLLYGWLDPRIEAY